MKSILILGAGLVSPPIVHYLTDRPEFEVTVASRTVSKAAALVAGRTRGKALALDIRNETLLEALITKCDLAVSLLPATEHVKVALLCLKHGKHMATTSYFSPAMLALDAEVKAKGLTFINECGVDPGTDHMSAMRVIHHAQTNGGKVVSFRSYCGGLPAPEANNNPLGYKFSWTPRGVLVAATNAAKYLLDGKVVQMPGNELFAAPEIVQIEGAGTFEGFPNRDCFPYIERYGLTDVKTMFRGTLRYPGHCEAWYRWVNLGLFEQPLRRDLAGKTLRQFMAGFGVPDQNVERGVARKMGVGVDHPAMAKLKWLGMFEDRPIPITEGGNIDVMAAQMLEKCPFAKGERDMLVMRHEFVVEYPGRTEKILSTMVDFGLQPDGDSSMARTVSLPVAIAVRMILEGSLTQRGVIAPLKPEVYNPILNELAAMNIRFVEEKY